MKIIKNGTLEIDVDAGTVTIRDFHVDFQGEGNTDRFQTAVIEKARNILDDEINNVRFK